MSGFEPGLEVEVDAPESTLESLLERVQTAWTRLGQQDAHWSVLTEADYRTDRIGGSIERFEATGMAWVERIARTLQRCGVPVSRQATCLEFGCGVGRMTQWLARHVATVHACDVSAPHLEQARAHLAARGVHDVHWHHVGGVRDVARLPAADFVVSEIVLQHNPPPVMREILRALLSRLLPGGTAVLQLPTYGDGYRFSCAEYLSRPPGEHGMEMHVLPQPIVFAEFSRAGVQVLEVLEDTKVGDGAPFLSDTFVVQRPGLRA